MSSTVRAIFHTDPTTDITSIYTTLSALTSAHPTTLVTRWRKKTVALRTKCLSRAWAAANGSADKKILERRPRLSDAILAAKSISELAMDEFLYACINVEQLATNPAALLNLVCSRAVQHPSMFGRGDYRCFVKPVLELFGIVWGGGQRKGKTEVIVIGGGEAEYGVLKTYVKESSEYIQGVENMLICPAEIEGTYLMRWQRTILEFCVAVVKDIISPIGPQKNPPAATASASDTISKLLENVPNYSLFEGDLESYSASMLLRPYTLPPINSVADTRYLAVSHLRAAEDHLGLLHTNSNYFITLVGNQLSQKSENIPAESPLAIQNALRQVLYTAYAVPLIWSQICLVLEDAELGNVPEAELFNAINPLLTLLRAFPESSLELYFSAAGKSKTKNVVNDFLMCLHPSSPSTFSNWLTLPRIAVEIEHLLVDTPLLKREVDPWIMDILSNVAAISEVGEAVYRFEPSLAKDNQASLKFGETAQTLSQLWKKIELGSFSDMTELQESLAGDGLTKFWRRVSAGFVKHSGKTLGAWITSTQGRIVDSRRKGRWHWQGNVWISEKAEKDEEYRKEEGKLPELMGIAGWYDIDGYGESSRAHTNVGGVPGAVETTPNKQKGDAEFAVTRRGVKRTIPDVRNVKPDPTKKISVTKRMYASVMQLSNGTPLAWKDFVHLMTNLGFTMEHIGGTLFRLIPAVKGDEAMIVKRPHPGLAMQSLECVSTWARLEQSYGWKVGLFEKELSTSEVKVAG